MLEYYLRLNDPLAPVYVVDTEANTYRMAASAPEGKVKPSGAKEAFYIAPCNIGRGCFRFSFAVMERRPDGSVRRYSVQDGRIRGGVGGAKVMKNGKALAFAGVPGNVCNSVEKCIRYADHYVWGDNLADALKKIKPYLED